MRNKYKSTVSHWIESRYFGLGLVGSFAVGVFVRLRGRPSIEPNAASEAGSSQAQAEYCDMGSAE
ncbi:hypothetical protein CRV24_004306 [Beauveria bassiana]|nr:hypothetical protein CRV24_004306 [Beauveria bassiana]KAH8710922.1 hypothetical protein HC256_007754 [Beauveria bassiana]